MISGGSTVCAYVPVGTEPGSIEMLDMLLRRAGRVLLPVARTAADDTPLPLPWGEYRPGHAGHRAVGAARAAAAVAAGVGPGRRRRGAGAGAGGRPPRRAAGPGPRLLRPLAGSRDPQARLIAVVRDEELLDELPADPHDVPMTHALTPRQRLDRSRWPLTCRE